MSFDSEEIPGVGPSTAEKLADAGYDSYKKIAVSSVGELSSEADIGSSLATDVINKARDEANVGGFGSGSSILQRRDEIGKLIFGVDALDDLLDGGIETQSLTELFGSEGSGRALIAHRLCVLVQLPLEVGGLAGGAIYIDTRGSFDPDTIVSILQSLSDQQRQQLVDRYDVNESELADIVLENIYVSKVDSVNEQIIMAEQAKSKAEDLDDTENPIRLVCVETVADHFHEEFQGRSELAERHQKLNKHLHDLMRIGDLFNTAILFTNYPGNKTDESYGGSILSHTTTFQIRLLQDSQTKRTARLVSAPGPHGGESKFRISGTEIDSE